MSKVYLKLDFKSAYLPIKSAFDNTEKKPKNPPKYGDVTFDYVSDKKGVIYPARVNRATKTTMVENTNDISTLLSFNNPISKNIIENIIAVLIGERPVSRFRKCNYELPAKVIEMAKDAYIKVVKQNDGSLVRVDKAYNDSDGTVQVAMWSTVEHYIGHDKIKAVRQYLKKYVDNADTEPLCNLQEEFTKHIVELTDDVELKKLCGKSITGIVNAQLCGYKFNGYKMVDGVETMDLSTVKARGLASVVTNNIPLLKNKKGISTFAVYDGSIILYIDEKDLELFANGNGVATILDGGALTIDCAFSEDNYSINELEYTAITDLNHIELPNLTITKLKEFAESYVYYLTNLKYEIVKDKIIINGELRDDLKERKKTINENPLKAKEKYKNFLERAKKANATEKNDIYTFIIN